MALGGLVKLDKPSPSVIASVITGNSHNPKALCFVIAMAISDAPQTQNQTLRSTFRGCWCLGPLSVLLKGGGSVKEKTRLKPTGATIGGTG